MKIPGSFRPDKNLDKKTEELIEGYEDYVTHEKNRQKIMDIMFKLNLSRGVLYTGLRPLEFKKSNLPHEKVVYAALACAKLGEGFYRYRFNYKSKGLDLRWLEVVDTKLENEFEFKQLVSHVQNYYNVPQSHRTKTKVYELRLNKPQSKKDLTDAVEKFYSLKFPYLGSKFNLFFTKIVYQGLTEEEFLNSNIHHKHIEINWRNFPKAKS